jgi:hypothetical protein
MKIEGLCSIPANAKETGGALRRIFCSLFLVTIAAALSAVALVKADAVGAVASPRVNQGLAAGSALPATSIVVINTNDNGPGSLRDALAVANDGDTIDATGVSGTILLTSGHLNVDKDVTISGPGANHLAVDGNGQNRVFYVSLGKTVTIDGLTVENGYSDYGAGIYSLRAVLTVSNCIISGNSGGGISNDEGTLTVSNCTISGNSGGGISSGAGPSGVATLTITDSTISGNSASYGGGILNAGSGYAALTVTNSTISGNSANYGGGILNTAAGSQGGSATVTLSNSTLSDNMAVGDGGGICNRSGHGASVSLSVENSTISNNLASGNGGGIYNAALQTIAGARLVVTNTTISGNSANGNGGGIYNSNNGGAAALVLGSAILKAGNLGENIFNAGGTVSSHGYNVSSYDGGGYLTGAGDQINTDPLIDALQDNGGPTFTHAVFPGSPAIDAGDPNFTPPPLYDQRGPGFARVANSRIDIGSFEVQAGPTPTPTPCSSWTPAAPVPYNAGGMFAASDGTYVYTGAGGILTLATTTYYGMTRRMALGHHWLLRLTSTHCLRQCILKGSSITWAAFLATFPK